MAESKSKARTKLKSQLNQITKHWKTPKTKTIQRLCGFSKFTSLLLEERVWVSIY